MIVVRVMHHVHTCGLLQSKRATSNHKEVQPAKYKCYADHSIV